MGLYFMEILREAALVRLAALEGVQHKASLTCPGPAPAEKGKLGNGFNLAEVAARLNRSRKFEHRLFAHSVAQPVRPAVHQNRRHKAVIPVVVVRQTPQRRFDSADYHRHLRVEVLENAGIDAHGPVRTLACTAIRSIGVIVAQALACGVMVNHRIHSPGIDSEVQARCPELAEITQIVPPVRLGDDCYTVAVFLEIPGYAGCSEARMVHKGISAEEDDVDVVPAQALYLLHGGGEHVILHRPGNYIL